jgi:hypothetical protein
MMRRSFTPVAILLGLLIGSQANAEHRRTAPKGGNGMSIETVLQRAASSDFAQYDPSHVIDAVNALQPLGKDKALDAVTSYLGKADVTHDPQNGLFLVLRVLFDVPAQPGYQPPMLLGSSIPPPPSDRHALPLFPIALVDDVPLLVVTGYALGGVSEPVSAHVEQYRKHGQLRASPLHPSKPTSDVLDKYLALYKTAYGSAPPAPQLQHIKAQLARLAPPAK